MEPMLLINYNFEKKSKLNMLLIQKLDYGQNFYRRKQHL